MDNDQQSGLSSDDSVKSMVDVCSSQLSSLDSAPTNIDESVLSADEML